MTSATSFFIILAIIIFSRGIIQINEQFLVAVCFIAFLYTAYTKVGDSILESLQTRAKKITADHLDYVKNHQAALTRVIKMLETQISINQRLHILSNFFKDQTKTYIALREQELINHVNQQILAQLESFSQKELAFRKDFQLALIDKFITQLTTEITSTPTEEFDNFDLNQIVLSQRVLPITSLQSIGINL